MANSATEVTRQATDGMRRASGSQRTLCWRKGDSNCRSLSRECRLIFAEEKGLQVVIRVVKTDRPFSRGDQRFESSSLRRQVTLSSHFSITRTTWAAPAPRQAFLASVAGASCTPWTSARYALASRRRTRRGQSSGFRLRLSGVGRVSSICCETLGPQVRSRVRRYWYRHSVIPLQSAAIARDARNFRSGRLSR